MRIIVLNKKRTNRLFYKLLLLLVLFSSIYIGSKETISVFSMPVKDMVVLIDAGHGGRDPGAIGVNGSIEDEINLAIALKLRRLIEQAGGLALMVREDDSGLYTEGSDHDRKREDLKNRRRLINESEADIFISIHLNSFPQHQYYGAQTFYPKRDEKGKLLAEMIQKELLAVLDRGNNRVAKPTDSVYVLRDNKIPCALVECGFISNSEEERLLQDDHYQEKVAWSIFVGIVRYFEQEKNESSKEP